MDQYTTITQSTTQSGTYYSETFFESLDPVNGYEIFLQKNIEYDFQILPHSPDLNMLPQLIQNVKVPIEGPVEYTTIVRNNNSISINWTSPGNRNIADCSYVLIFNNEPEVKITTLPYIKNNLDPGKIYNINVTTTYDSGNEYEHPYTVSTLMEGPVNYVWYNIGGTLVNSLILETINNDEIKEHLITLAPQPSSSSQYTTVISNSSIVDISNIAPDDYNVTVSTTYNSGNTYNYTHPQTITITIENVEDYSIYISNRTANVNWVPNDDTLHTAIVRIGIPVITLSGDSTITIEKGMYNDSTYPDDGATAINFIGISFDVISGDNIIDFNKAGTYYVPYTTGVGYASAVNVIRTVIVKDTTSPVIELVEGSDTIYVGRGISITEPGYSATDFSGINLSNNVEINYPSTNDEGTYTITYNVEDESKNQAVEQTRTLVVVPPPIITIYDEGSLVNEGQTIIVEKDRTSNPLTATAIDAYGVYIDVGYDDTDIVYTTIGTYTITYTTTDDYGSETSRSNVVLVRDIKKIKPKMIHIYGDYLYYYNKELLNYSDHKAKAVHNFGFVTSIHDVSENDIVLDLIPLDEHNPDKFDTYIGGEYFVSEDRWGWHDQTPFDINLYKTLGLFAPGQPDRANFGVAGSPNLESALSIMHPYQYNVLNEPYFKDWGNKWNDIIDQSTKSAVYKIPYKKLNPKTIVYGDSLYYYSSERLTFDDHQTKAVLLGGHLASIQNVIENKIIIDLIPSDVSFNTFIGGEYIDNRWQWLDGTDFTIDNYNDFFIPGQPDRWDRYGNGNNESILEIVSILGDYSFPNGWETKWNDTYKDTNIQHGIYKIPVNFAIHNNTTFVFSNYLESYERHKTIGNTIGGTLASIRDASENLVILEMGENNDVYSYFLGGERSEDGFEWIDGTNFQYTNWYDNQPDNHNGEEDVIEIYIIPTDANARGKWNDIPGTLSRAAVYRFD